MDFNFLKIKNGEALPNLENIEELEAKYPRIDIEKTQLRKQIDLFKNALRSQFIDEDELIYKIKIALLKFHYQMSRYKNNVKVELSKQEIKELNKFQIKELRERKRKEKIDYLNNFENFFKGKVKKFIDDILQVTNLNDNLKKDYLRNLIKFFKDFLNAIIIKSYH